MYLFKKNYIEELAMKEYSLVSREAPDLSAGHSRTRLKSLWLFKRCARLIQLCPAIYSFK